MSIWTDTKTFKKFRPTRLLTPYWKMLPQKNTIDNRNQEIRKQHEIPI